MPYQPTFRRRFSDKKISKVATLTEPNLTKQTLHKYKLHTINTYQTTNPTKKKYTYLVKKRAMILLILFCTSFVNIVVSKLPPLGQASSKELDDCTSCKNLVGSINYWLEQTARGKFEGGDAHWEESKLRSYSRSEVRLVEIQEGLCSELKKNKDECYTLAEQAEELIEKWWFDKDSTSLDIQSWLCNDKLAYCCPAHHFGPNCLPCLKDTKNSICSNNGVCLGEGTRKGSGKCKCNVGYTGEICNQCHENYFQPDVSKLVCERCDKSCSICKGAGPDNCVKCNLGYELNGTKCNDVDECVNNPCKKSEYCVNIEGSYTCIVCHNSCETCFGKRHDECLTCKSKFSKWSNLCLNKEKEDRLKYQIYLRLILFLSFIILFYVSYNYSIYLTLVTSVAFSFYVFYDSTSRLLFNTYFGL